MPDCGVIVLLTKKQNILDCCCKRADLKRAADRSSLFIGVRIVNAACCGLTTEWMLLIAKNQRKLACLFDNNGSACLSVYRSVCLPACLYVYLYVCLSVCLSASLLACLG